MYLHKSTNCGFLRHQRLAALSPLRRTNADPECRRHGSQRSDEEVDAAESEVDRLQRQYAEAARERDALLLERETRRKRAADIHWLLCSANAKLSGMTPDEQSVLSAFSDISAAIRLNTANTGCGS